MTRPDLASHTDTNRDGVCAEMTLDLAVGTNLPALALDRGGRRFPTTVHAVDPELEVEPYRALCGVFMIYRYLEHVWPPGLAEDWCPACVRQTECAWLADDTG